MSHYRAPPAVLPSLRDYTTETAATIRGAVPDPIERGFLRWARRLDDYPFVAATLDDATREDDARARAASAPCPAFVVDPAAVLPPARKVFQCVLPPPKTLSLGRPVFV